LSFTTDQEVMRKQLEGIEPGSYDRSLQYVGKGYEMFRLGIDKLIARNYDHVFQFVNPANLALLVRLKTYLNNYSYAGKFFRHPHLKMAYTFQNIYVGQSPYDSPALFSMIPAAELTEGSFFPALKYALALCGLPCGECRKPFQPISDITKELVATKLVEYGIVKRNSKIPKGA